MTLPTAPYPLLEDLSNSVCLLSADGHVLWANAVSQELFQMGAARLQTCHASELLSQMPDAKNHADWLVTLLNKLHAQHHCSLRFDCVLRATLSHVRTVHATLSKVQHRESLLTAHKTGFFWLELLPLDLHLDSYNDAKEREESELNKAWLLNLAHELKNPLGGISGVAQLIRDEVPASAQEYVDVMQAEIERMTTLLDNMLLPQRTRGKVERCNIHELCAYVSQTIKAQYPSIKITGDYDVSLPLVEVVRDQWIQILLNLLQNAAQELVENEQHNLINPQIVLRTRVVHRQTFNKQLHPMCLQLEIADNGRGVPEQLHHTLFHPLVTGRAAGTGLGLALVQSVVHQHGGDIRYSKAPSGGAMFTIRLPFGRN